MLDLSHSFRVTSKMFAAIGALIGVFVLIGWTFDVEVLKSVFPGVVTMKANTALCFVFLGVSLLTIQRKFFFFYYNDVGRAFAFLVFLIGVLTLCEYYFGWDLKIDQLLFQEPVGTVMTVSPGRMALNTAVSFVLMGVGVVLTSLTFVYVKILAQALFVISGLVALLALLGYTYGIDTFHFGIAKFAAMALHTATAFILLSLSGILAWPEVGIMKLFTSDLRAGIIARRSLGATVVALIVTDMMVFIGVSFRFYDVTFATALHVIVLFAVFAFLIIVMGFTMMRDEKNRMAYEQKYETLYNSSPEAIMVLDPGKYFTGANPSTLRMFRCASEEEFKTKMPSDLSPEYQPDGEPSNEKSQRMMDIAKEKGMNFFEWKHKRMDGKEFWATVLLSRTKLGGRPVFQATVRDIDSQKKQQLDLEKKIKELEKFQNITMDREKRIIELKNEIKELKKKQEAK